MSANRILTTQAAEPRPSIKIAGRQVGGGAPAYLIAEVAQAHDGSLGLAHRFIDAAKEAGADAVKFQTHFADEESTLDEPFRVKFSQQDKTRFAYWKRMEFTEEQWAGLAAHARETDIGFLSSAFSPRAVELLERLGVPAWKIASGELASDALLDQIAATGKPMVMSTGMSSYGEIETTLGRLRQAGVPVAVLQCTSRYPDAAGGDWPQCHRRITAAVRLPGGPVRPFRRGVSCAPRHRQRRRHRRSAYHARSADVRT